MPFTNDDLIRLLADDYKTTKELMKDLVARLEAAEAVCERLGEEPDLRDMKWFIPTNKLWKKWRKTAGKS